MDNNWETVKNRSTRSTICESYSKFGVCKCRDTNNKRHPFICSNIEKYGRCTFKNCRMFHPTELKIKQSFSPNNKFKKCYNYIYYGYCECIDKNNSQHPYLCKDYINGICDKEDCKFFHIKKKKTNNKDLLCSMYEEKGFCKDLQCSQIHPPLCRIYKCEQGNKCKYYHPLRFPSICNSVNNNERCKYKKCNFYHPMVCIKDNCDLENCLLYHPKKVIKFNDIINWVSNKNNLEESILYYEKNLKELVENYNEWIIENVRKQLAKNRRYDILEYLNKNNENIILNRRRFNDKIHVYSEILWPRDCIENEELFLEEFINTKNIFINKSFDIFCFNNQYNESIFGVINNKSNYNMSENLRNQICLYFLNEWNNEEFILRSFRNMWQLITDTTKEKMWKYLIFLIYKNPEKCISYLSKDLFKDFGTQKTENIVKKINNIIQLLSEIPKNDNDIYYIYNLIEIDWNLRTNKYIKFLLENLENDYNKDNDNLNQNSLRYGTLLGLLYKTLKETRSQIIKTVSDFSNINIVEIFIEWYHFGDIDVNEEIVKKFLNEIYPNIKGNKKKFEIERKMNLKN